jgi:hypothetical protein
MPVAHQLILGLIIAGFVFYPTVLLATWIVTRGWKEEAPRPPESQELEAVTGEELRKAA